MGDNFKVRFSLAKGKLLETGVTLILSKELDLVLDNLVPRASNLLLLL
jgi:hypothetical protein